MESASRAVRGATQAVLLHLERYGASSRSELAAALDLPLTTVTSAVARLLRLGQVVQTGVEGGAATRRTGRPATRIALATAPPPAVVAVVGGEVLTTALVASGGDVLHRVDVPFRPLAVDDLATPVAAQMRSVVGAAGSVGAAVTRAVLAIPAPIRTGRTEVGAPRPAGPTGFTLPRWLDVDPVDDLAALTGLDAFTENDANLAALSEAAVGAGAGHQTVLYVKMLPRIGAGLVIGGRLHRGAHGYIGELAHAQVRSDGPLCICGSRGCLLTTPSARALVEAVRPTGGGSIGSYNPNWFDARDPGLLRVLDDVGVEVGKALGAAVMFADPDVIVLDGALRAAVPHFTRGVRRGLRAALPADLADRIAIAPGRFDGDAELVGGGVLAHQVVAG